MKILCIVWIMLVMACASPERESNGNMFKDDVEFLSEHSDLYVLKSKDEQAQVVVIPALQGRVMTSTATGPDGLSYGWINRELIASGEVNKHINAFGGEDRFWMGPEGGQFSIFFKSGAPFDLEYWWTPEPLNEEPYPVVEEGEDFVRFEKEMEFVNYSDEVFKVALVRKVVLLDRQAANSRFGFEFPDLPMVAFESQNVIKNVGNMPWKKQTGLLSIWILGMYNPSPATTIVIPFKEGPVEELGPKVNDAYFGEVPNDRLIIQEDVLFFLGDGQYRSKIGISPSRATSILGSYDETNKVLTLVTFNKPQGELDYVNSMWEIQDEPYTGDVVNSYNDGPAEPDAEPMGPFYELETSSPAAELALEETLEHIHTTLHITGSESELEPIAESLLGVTLSEIKSAF